MSDVASLQKLRDHRDALLLAEVGALLHDVGKLSFQFIDQMSSTPSSHSHRFEHEKAVRLPGFVDAQLLNALENSDLRNQLRWQAIPNNEQISLLLDLIAHHDKPKHSAFLVRLLNRCDGIDSGADKGTTRSEGLPNEAKQPFDQTFIATAFGNEAANFRIDTAKLDSRRQKLSSKVGKTLKDFLDNRARKRFKILCLCKVSYQCGLGETRRSANDVTLWDHSFSVATLYKTSLAKFLLTPDSFDIANLRWRLLRVNFDVLGLYGKAVKIGDLLGYQRVVEEACEAVKKLIEEKYPLGNEIYRDSTGIYFTFPDMPLPADLAQEIHRRVEEVEMELAPRIAVTEGDGNTPTEQLKGILGKARGEAQKELAQPFDSQNLSACWQQQWRTVGPGKCEICPVCGLRPMREGAEACTTCLQRRGSRIEAWASNPQRTIWIDEIADHNGRVALIVGKFGLDDWLSGDLVQTMLVRCDPNNGDPSKRFVPKNPSPARLRRVWETCQRFWTETVEQEILAKLPQRARWELVPENPLAEKTPPREMALDGTLNGQPISVFRIGDRLLIISFVTQPQKGTLTITWEEDGRKRRGQIAISQTKTAQDELAKYQSYLPSLPLLSSPDQFLALVPAADALCIAGKIRSEYQKQFGKVQNRLPLFLGLIFFPRKMPLMVVMDTARRMLNGVKLGEEAWQVECSCLSEDHQTRHLRLAKDHARITYEVPIKMGDGTTDDVWYPYFFVERFANGTPDTRPYRSQHNNHWLVHVNDLHEGDTVWITPSRFVYLFLESAARRFAFNPQKDTLLLDELPRLSKMWTDICSSPEMTDTKLQAIHALFESKRQAWRLAEPITSGDFRQLVETTFKCEGLQSLSVDDVLNGRFRRCIDLVSAHFEASRQR